MKIIDLLNKKQNRRLFMVIISIALATMIFLFISMTLHEYGHYAVLESYGYEPYITYNVSEIAGFTHWDNTTPGINLSAIDEFWILFSGGFFSGIILLALWFVGFVPRKGAYHVGIEYGLLVNTVNQFKSGFFEAFISELEFIDILNNISLVLIAVIVGIFMFKRFGQWIENLLDITIGVSLLKKAKDKDFILKPPIFDKSKKTEKSENINTSEIDIDKLVDDKLTR